MGITLNKNGRARAPRTGTNLGTPLSTPRTFGRPRVSWGLGFFEFFMGMLVLLWWLIKVAAFVIFIIALVAILGALFNDNAPTGHDIAWLIISIVAMIIL